MELDSHGFVWDRQLLYKQATTDALVYDGKMRKAVLPLFARRQGSLWSRENTKLMIYTTLLDLHLSSISQDRHYCSHRMDYGTANLGADVPKLCGSPGRVLDGTYRCVSANVLM